MTFLIVTHVEHKKFAGSYYAYGPYIKEMNLWIKYADKILILAPLSSLEHPGEIDLAYVHPAIDFIPVPDFNLVGFKALVRSVFIIPSILVKTFRTFKIADHIHLRCPGNMGLVGCIGQIFFPNKVKTAKYAGNWDRRSSQPWSYRLQRELLNNNLLTKNMHALVYGHWPDQSKNIVPFFTASYHQSESTAISPRDIHNNLKLLFVGSLTKNKQPLISCMVVKKLLEKNIPVLLNIYGEGPHKEIIDQFIAENRLEKVIHLHGNQRAEVVKMAYTDTHFLVFISESEGWPKVVAEAMWWACLPITTAVSCVPEMVGFGERGDLVNPDADEIVKRIEYYISNSDVYISKCKLAMEWSRQFTLERFEDQIKKLI